MVQAGSLRTSSQPRSSGRFQLFSEGDLRIERVWCGESIGTKLVVRHCASGMSAERVIGFDDEGAHKRELVAELKQRFFAQFPDRDFILENAWMGPGKGAALRLIHRPSGTEVGRVIGYDRVADHKSGMMAEMIERLRDLETGPTE